MNGNRPRNRPEVYAEQAVWIRDNPLETVPLQAVRRLYHPPPPPRTDPRGSNARCWFVRTPLRQLR